MKTKITMYWRNLKTYLKICRKCRKYSRGFTVELIIIVAKFLNIFLGKNFKLEMLNVTKSQEI